MAPSFKYAEDQMRAALKAVREDGISVNSASKKYNVPRTTLSDKLKKKVPEERKMGPQSVLSVFEEEQLVRWIFLLGEAGFPVTKDQLLDSVRMLTTKAGKVTPFTNNRPGKHWYEAFMRRHPDIARSRTAQNLSKARASVTEAKIRNWFTEIQLHYTENNLTRVIEDPQRIFNCDETAFFLSPKGNQVLVKKGQKAVYNFINSNEKECITTLVTGNAAGELAPPMIMIACKRMPAPIVAAMPESWGLGKSDNGWMTAESFYEFVANIFHPWLVEKGIPLPIVLYVDGHSSHITMALSDFCRANQIVLVALYPNSTHILQPMDVAMFRPLKQAWKNVIHSWRMKHNAAVLKRENFPPLLKKAIDSIDSGKNLQSGFRTCGLFPFDPNAVNYSKLLQIDTKRSARDESDDEELHQAKEHLRYFESQQSTEKIKTFEQSGETWKGIAEDLSLFNYWLSLKRKVGQKNSVPSSRERTGEILNIYDHDAHSSINFPTSPVMCDNTTTTLQDDIPNLRQDIDLFLLDGSESFEPFNSQNIQEIEISNSVDIPNSKNDDIVQCLNIVEHVVYELPTPCDNSQSPEAADQEIGDVHDKNSQSSNTTKENTIATPVVPEEIPKVVVQEAAFPRKSQSPVDGGEEIGDVHDVNISSPTAVRETTVATVNYTERAANEVAEGEAHPVKSPHAERVTTEIGDSQKNDLESSANTSDTGITETGRKKCFKRLKTETVVPCISPAFKETLFWPPALHESNIKETNSRRKPKEKVPAVVSSLQWQQYYKEKENRKQEALLQKEERKRKREEKTRIALEVKRQKQEAKEERRRIAKEAKDAQKPKTKNTQKAESQKSSKQESRKKNACARKEPKNKKKHQN